MKSLSKEKRAIEQVESSLCKAELAMNVDQIMELYLPDETLHVFDIIKPRQYIGAKAFRKDWEGFFANHAKSIDVCEHFDLVIEVSGNLAVSHYIQHAEFTDKNGKSGEANTRLTHVYRKVKGKWLIVHEHGSFPIDWATGKGDLQER